MCWSGARQFTVSVVLSIVSCISGAAMAEAQQNSDLALIVSAKNPVSDITMRELRRIFTGERRALDGRHDVLLMVPPPGTPERDTMLRAIYNMSEADYKNFWLGKKFRGEAGGEPLVVASKQLLNDARAGYEYGGITRKGTACAVPVVLRIEPPRVPANLYCGVSKNPRVCRLCSP